MVCAVPEFAPVRPRGWPPLNSGRTRVVWSCLCIRQATTVGLGGRPLPSAPALAGGHAVRPVILALLTYEDVRSNVFVYAASPYRRRTRNPDDSLEPRSHYRPRGPRRLECAQAHSVHHGTEDAANHVGKG